MTTMNCRELCDRLDDLLEGRLTPGERRAAEEHLRECPRCGDLRILLGRDPGDLDVAPPPDLTEAVMRRTAGRACAGARGRLCDHVDRALDPIDDELVRLHLEGCGACAALARALAALSADLPALAEMRPDAAFVGDVLARTLPGRRWPARLAARVTAGWRQLVERPRLAWEGAYVGAILVVLIFGTPNSPLAGVPRRALDLVSANPVAGIRTPVEEYAPRVRSSVESVWQEARGKVVETTRSVSEDVTRRSSGLIERIRHEAGTIWDRLTSEQMTDDDNDTTSHDVEHGEGEER